MIQNQTPYAISDEVKMMLETVRRFRLQDLEPIWQQVDEEDRMPEEVVQKMRELGLFGMATPKDYGGLGLTALEEAMVQEELSKSAGCFRSRIAGTNGIGCQGIVIDGTEEQKSKYLPKFASGEWTAAFAMTEPDAGSDAASIKTKAELKGDHWVLNGTKQFITNGPSANLITVMAVTDPEKRARGGITAFLVENTFPGFKRGAVDSGMGLRGNPTCQLIFDDCIVPRENVIGGDKMIGSGFKTAMRIMDKGRLFIAAHALGGAQRCLELAAEYAKTRVQFGKPIAEFQLIQGMLAEMATDVHASRQMLYHTAWLRDKFGTQVLKEASMVKLFCTEAALRVVNKAVQIHGGYGWQKGYHVERFYRDLRLLTIFEGTSEIQKVVISRELLKEV
ncbi:MAG: acyl-CoA dehydrogenase family protein [Proteobacteria bacterium]|nr:acyl-CoA dehydrogenase family protein [Pseudomonadota bacterium]MBU4576519.1 acyl-CoA dehydrogenase family protein [Pseudomonadota bacterium]